MFLSIIFILLIIFGIGLPLVLLIASKVNNFVKLGLSFPLGIGIFTLLMFGSNLLGFKYTLLNEVVLLLILSIPLVLTQLKKMKALFGGLKEIAKNTKLDLAEKLLLSTSLFLVITSFIYTFYWPVHMWDSVVLYNFRGYVFALIGYLKDAFINGYYYGYPLLTSLAHTIVYLCGGKYPQFIYSIFYLSLGISFFGVLREFISRKGSLLFTLLLLITGPLFYHSLYSYTNLTYTVYLSLGAILIYLWDKKGNVGYLILSALLIGLSTWVRSSEPFWFVILVALFVISLFVKKLKSIFVYAPIVLLIRQAWISYQSFLASGGVSSVADAVSNNSLLSSLLDTQLWGQILVYLYKHTIVPWGTIFILFVLSLLIIVIKKDILKSHWVIHFIIILLLASLVLGTFGISLTVDFWYRIGDAVQRLSMLFYPLFIYSLALVVYDLAKKDK